MILISFIFISAFPEKRKNIENRVRHLDPFQDQCAIPPLDPLPFRIPTAAPSPTPTEFFTPSESFTSSKKFTPSPSFTLTIFLTTTLFLTPALSLTPSRSPRATHEIHYPSPTILPVDYLPQFYFDNHPFTFYAGLYFIWIAMTFLLPIQNKTKIQRN